VSADSNRDRNAVAMLVDAQIAATNGNRRALVYRDKNYSFHDLAALVNRAGNMLRSMGVERGERVMIVLSPSPALIGAMLGAIKIGAIAIMTGVADAAKIRSACDRHQPLVAIIDGSRLDELRPALGATKLIVAGDSRDNLPALLDLLQAAPSSLAAEAVNETDLALIVIDAEGEKSANHANLAREASGQGSLRLRLGALDLSAALARLAECHEVNISGQ
jgi:acyl-coenzyme A synthetase/AMP-(fatty) acid ligase